MVMAFVESCSRSNYCAISIHQAVRCLWIGDEQDVQHLNVYLRGTVRANSMNVVSNVSLADNQQMHFWTVCHKE